LRYDWLLIDADGTLFDYDRAEAAALRAALAEAGIDFVPEHLVAYRAINARMWEAFERGDLARGELRRARFEELSELFSLGLEPGEFGRRYLARLAEGADLIDGARDLVARLHGRVGMVLLTNGFAEVQRPRVAASGIGHLFDHVVISGEVGVAKPAAGIFDLAFERMGSPRKERVLIVGDGLGSDIRGGIDYGIDTCWYNPAGDAVAAPRPRYEIRSLMDLLSIVEG
jgi:2-haloacid dehalogenase